MSSSDTPPAATPQAAESSSSTTNKRKTPDSSTSPATETKMPKQKKQRTSQKRRSNKSMNIKNRYSDDVENLDSELYRKYYKDIETQIFSKTVETDENCNVTIHTHEDPAAEFKTMYNAYKKPLPITFRVNPVHEKRAEYINQQLNMFGKQIEEKQIKKGDFYRQMDEKRCLHLNTQLKKLEEKPKDQLTEDNQAALENYRQSLDTINKRVYDDAFVPKPKPLSWFPRQLGFYMPISKRFLSKMAPLSSFKEFLLAQTESGNISRQEMVSMLPTQFFDYQPHHKILDMCAAPGSKTAQLLEGLHLSGKNANKPVTGFVVANDNNIKRCHLLVKQLQRLGPLFANMIITSHDATKYPALKSEGKQIYFDSILCDVMCSGDGTLRKSADLWRVWNPHLGNALHEMQISVTMRAFKLLTPNGRIVYSTCSINPVEDEAVVAEVIRRSKGKLRLVDCSARLKNFKYSPGITEWNVCNKSGKIMERSDAADTGRIRHSMFPPTEEEAKSMNLHHCMRILPHLQDSGGFFVAVLERVPEDEQTANNAADLDTMEDNVSGGVVKEARGKSTGELEYSDISQDFHNKIVEFYGLEKDLFPYGTLFNRRDSKQKFREDVPKRIFYVPQTIRKILNFNEVAGRKWKIINVGLRIFEHAKRIVTSERHLSVEQYRICQEGVDILYDHSTKRHLRFPFGVFAELLKRRELMIPEIEEFVKNHETSAEEKAKEEAFVKTVKEFEFGPCMAVDETDFCPVAAHRTPYSLQLYCKKEMQSALLHNLHALHESQQQE